MSNYTLKTKGINKEFIAIINNGESQVKTVFNVSEYMQVNTERFSIIGTIDLGDFKPTYSYDGKVLTSKQLYQDLGERLGDEWIKSTLSQIGKGHEIYMIPDMFEGNGFVNFHYAVKVALPNLKHFTLGHATLAIYFGKDATGIVFVAQSNSTRVDTLDNVTNEFIQGCNDELDKILVMQLVNEATTECCLMWEKDLTLKVNENVVTLSDTRLVVHSETGKRVTYCESYADILQNPTTFKDDLRDKLGLTASYPLTEKVGKSFVCPIASNLLVSEPVEANIPVSSVEAEFEAVDKPRGIILADDLEAMQTSFLGLQYMLKNNDLSDCDIQDIGFGFLIKRNGSNLTKFVSYHNVGLSIDEVEDLLDLYANSYKVLSLGGYCYLITDLAEIKNTLTYDKDSGCVDINGLGLVNMFWAMQLTTKTGKIVDKQIVNIGHKLEIATRLIATSNNTINLTYLETESNQPYKIELLWPLYNVKVTVETFDISTPYDVSLQNAVTNEWYWLVTELDLGEMSTLLHNFDYNLYNGKIRPNIHSKVDLGDTSCKLKGVRAYALLYLATIKDDQYFFDLSYNDLSITDKFDKGTVVTLQTNEGVLVSGNVTYTYNVLNVDSSQVIEPIEAKEYSEEATLKAGNLISTLVGKPCQIWVNNGTNTNSEEFEPFTDSDSVLFECEPLDSLNSYDPLTIFMVKAALGLQFDTIQHNFRLVPMVKDNLAYVVSQQVKLLGSLFGVTGKAKIFKANSKELYYIELTIGDNLYKSTMLKLDKNPIADIAKLFASHLNK